MGKTVYLSGIIFLLGCLSISYVSAQVFPLPGLSHRSTSNSSVQMRINDSVHGPVTGSIQTHSTSRGYRTGLPLPPPPPLPGPTHAAPSYSVPQYSVPVFSGHSMSTGNSSIRMGTTTLVPVTPYRSYPTYPGYPR